SPLPVRPRPPQVARSPYATPALAFPGRALLLGLHQSQSGPGSCAPSAEGRTSSQAAGRGGLAQPHPGSARRIVALADLSEPGKYSAPLDSVRATREWLGRYSLKGYHDFLDGGRSPAAFFLP